MFCVCNLSKIGKLWRIKNKCTILTLRCNFVRRSNETYIQWNGRMTRESKVVQSIKAFRERCLKFRKNFPKRTQKLKIAHFSLIRFNHRRRGNIKAISIILINFIERRKRLYLCFIFIYVYFFFVILFFPSSFVVGDGNDDAVRIN